MLRPPKYPRHADYPEHAAYPQHVSEVSELPLLDELRHFESKVIPVAGIVESFKAVHLGGSTNAGTLRCVEVLPGHEWGVHLSKPMLLSTVDGNCKVKIERDSGEHTIRTSDDKDRFVVRAPSNSTVRVKNTGNESLFFFTYEESTNPLQPMSDLKPDYHSEVRLFPAQKEEGAVVVLSPYMAGDTTLEHSHTSLLKPNTPPGAKHHHEHKAEWLYVMRGKVKVTLANVGNLDEARFVDLNAGMVLEIPPHVYHNVQCLESEPAFLFAVTQRAYTQENSDTTKIERVVQASQPLKLEQKGFGFTAKL